MAYLADDSDELAKQKAAAGGADAGQNTSGVIGATTGAANASGGVSGGAVDTKAPTSTGFVNLDQYLTANQGQGARLAGDATKGLVDQSNQFTAKAASTVTDNAGAFSGASRDAEAGQLRSGLASDAASTYDSASKYLGASYAGPKAQDYTADLAATQGTLDQNLNKVDDNANQQALLKQAYGTTSNPYTSGLGQLDSFLIGGSQGGRDAIGAVKARTADVDNAYNSASSSLQSMQSAAAARLAANQQGLKDTARSATADIVNQGQAAAAKMNAGINANYINTAQASLGDTLSQKRKADLHALTALSGEAWNPAWDVAATYNAGIAASPPPPAAAPPSTVGNIGDISGDIGALGQIAGGNFGGAVANQASNLNPITATKNALGDVASAAKNGGIPTQIGGTKLKKPRW